MPAPKGNKYALGNNGGRPTKYKPEYAEQAEKLCLLGATDDDMADFFEVNESTITRWKEKYEEFRTSLKKAKQISDKRVVKSLYQRAIGYEHDDLYISQYQGGIVKEKIIKHYPPDTTACIFWLKNRDPGNWRDRQEHEHSQKEPWEITIKMIENDKDNNTSG